MASVHRSLVLSFVERYALIGLTFVSTILLARLLSPEEIGIYAVATALIGIAQVVRDFGIGSFLIQEKNLTEAHVRTAFGMSLLIGGSLYCITYFASPLIGRFYSDTRLTGIVHLIALNFLLLPFCSISMSLLRRNMQFGRIMAANVSASIASFSVTIGLAWFGHGPASLAWGALAGNAVTGLVAWFARTDPKFMRPSLSEWRTILNFGGQSTLAGVVTSVAMDINELVVGKVLGFAPVAILSRAQGLMNLFHRDIMAAIHSVAFPYFAKAHREGDSLDARYIASVTSVTVIAWPFYGFISLFALEILRLIFGPQWDEAAQLVPIFCAAGSVSATFSLIPHAIVAIGRVDIMTKFALIFQPLRASFIIFAALIFETLSSCALAYLAAVSIHAYFLYRYKNQCMKSDLTSLCKNLWLSVKVTIGTLAVPSLVVGIKMLSENTTTTPFLFIVATVGAGITWPIFIIFFKHPLATDPLFKRLFGVFSFFAQPN